MTHAKPSANIKRALYLIILVASLTLAGCNPAGQESGVVLATPLPFGGGFQSYLHPSGVFSLRLPPAWAITDLSTSDALLVEFSPPGAMRAPLSIHVLNTGAPLSLEAFEHAIDAYQAAYYSATYTAFERHVQADGSWLVPALRQAGPDTLQINTFFQRSGPFFVAMSVLVPDDPALLETLDAVIDTLAIDPAATLTPGQIVAPAAPLDQAATGVIEFRGMFAWTDTQGAFHINGEVLNNDPAALEFVRITAYLFDATGAILAEQSDFAAADVIESGAAAPFSILFPQGKPALAVRYELHAAARHTELPSETYYGPSNFVLDDHADFNDQGYLVVSGTVTNQGASVAHYVKVTVTIFDGQGRVVATDTLFAQTQDFMPGASADYQLTFFELGGEAVRYTSSVQASLKWP